MESNAGEYAVATASDAALDLIVHDEVAANSTMEQENTATPFRVEKSLSMTVEEAQLHITQIRREKGVDTEADEDPSSNVADLTAALDILSDQLYTHPTHFLLETIQNADDNNYVPNVLPTISFHSTPGFLHIKCNETGFMPSNVQAICRIGSSTKKDRSKGFIGEKGIGFKSVFKIASVVSISSNAYSFKFRRDGPLGMILPIWDSFPIAIQKGHTQFYLELTKQNRAQNEVELQKQLRKFDSTLLLFLRNLKQISVSIDDGSKTVEGKFTKHICRQNTQGHAGEMVRIYGDHKRLRKNVEDSDYLLVRHTATEMPIEAKRRAMTNSEVIIAFPFKQHKPTFFKQKAYAFLPIRESNFRFLLQADFILIANREDVEASNDWNDHLLWALARCFAKAVERFNSPGAEAVKFAWLGFLQDLPAPGTNRFAPVGERIIKSLQMQQVFASQGGILVRPRDAIFVPPAFRDEDGKFILAGDADIKHYLAHNYEEHDPKYVVMQQLGVDILDFSRFIDLLKLFIAEHYNQYTGKSSIWHSSLARILLDMASFSDLRALPILQLQDSSWIRPVDGQCHFETNDSKVLGRLPAGITNLKIIHSSASQDKMRRKLLEKIGVKDLNTVEVCRLLCVFHDSPKPPSLDLEALLYHATYLYEVTKAGYYIQKPKTFWVQDADSEMRLSTSVYQDPVEGRSPNMISSMLSKTQWASRLLHPAYQNEYAAKALPKFAKWLESVLGIRSVLRLVDSQSRFTAEFRYVIEHATTEHMLEVIMAAWLRDHASLASQTIKQMVGAIEVTCEDGTKTPLNQTCLPVTSLKTAAVVGIPFLKLDPPVERWKTLSVFGVVDKPSLEFYLRCLALLQRNLVLDTPNLKAQLFTLYKNIEATFSQDDVRIREFFKKNPAIYIPDKGIWVSNNDTVVWEPTPGVTGEHALQHFYPTLYSLFFGNLKIRSATIEKVIIQLRTLPMPPGENDSLVRKSLIYSLSVFLKRTPGNFGKLRDLLDVPVMPIAGKHGLMATQLSSLNKSTWLFRDRHDYLDAFNNLQDINFADFDVEDYPRLEALNTAISKAWNCADHCMSKNVKEIEDLDTQAVLNIDLTSFLRGKLKFIRRVVRQACGSGNSETRRTLEHLHRLKVLHAPKMIVKTSLFRGQLGKPLEGRPMKPEALHKSLIGEVHFYVRDNVPTPNLRRALGEQLQWFCRIGQDKLKMLILHIMLEDDDRRVYDKLLMENVGGHEEQQYQPLPVQPDIIIPRFDNQRLPLTTITNEVQIVSAVAIQPATIMEPGQLLQPDLAPSSFTPRRAPETSKDENGNVAPVLNGAALLSKLRTGQRILHVSGFSAGPASFGHNGQAASSATQPNVSQPMIHIGSSNAHHASVKTYDPKEYTRPSSSGRGSGRPTLPYKRSSSPQSNAPIAYKHLSTIGVTPIGKSLRVPTFRSEADQKREHQIGLQGEQCIYSALQDIFGDSFVRESCWTSELRGLAAGMSKWVAEDVTANYADFTIDDRGGLFTQWLAKEHGITLPSTTSSRTFHVEVKSTSNGPNEPFHMSPLQMAMAEEYALSTNLEAQNVFVIFRVAGIGNGNGNGNGITPQLQVYVDPSALFKSGGLLAEVENWLVWPGEVGGSGSVCVDMGEFGTDGDDA